MAKALEGIRVLDLTRMYAGPYGTMLLGELGADVIKVEIPGGGDAIRTTAPLTEAQESHRFVILNRGKRGVTLNITTEEGQKICKELVAKSDVLIENFSPSVMERYNLGYEQLKQINPQLIYTSISGYGHTGPRSSQLAFDTIIQAMGGIISINGQPDSPPTKVGVAIADFMGGAFSVISILAALQSRTRTNMGQHIDLSMQDCIFALTAMQFIPTYVATGREPKKIGNRQLEVTPFNIYPAQDGYIVIATVTVGQWESLLEVLGKEDLKDVPEYASQATRIDYAEEMDVMLEEWTKGRTVEDMLEQLQAAGIPCAPVPSFGQVVNDPQIAARNMQVEVDQLLSGQLKVPGSVFKMSETPGDPTQPAPFLGQHNMEVFSELLGYDDIKIARLQDQGVI